MYKAKNAKEVIESANSLIQEIKNYNGKQKLNQNLVASSENLDTCLENSNKQVEISEEMKKSSEELGNDKILDTDLVITANEFIRMVKQRGLDFVNLKDGNFNEDGEGGVHFNKNMSYAYPNFVPGSGEHMVSENENRALLDHLFEQFNIHTVITFGPYNNLSSPATFNPQAVSKRIITGYYESDAKTNAHVSELYNKITGFKDAPKTSSTGGDFANWAYFHYGRNSFSTPGWWVPKAKADTAKKQKDFKIDDQVANYLRWAESEKIENTFVTWKKIDHPDFPGKNVELGGLDPFVLLNPPFKMVDGLVKKHHEFILALSKKTPSLDIINIQQEKLGDGLTRITATIMNNGLMATQTKVGERSYWVKKISVKLNHTENQKIISGRKNQVLDAIEGQGHRTLSWLIKGSGKISIDAGSPTSGSKTIDLSL
jgi:hypothetical protein